MIYRIEPGRPVVVTFFVPLVITVGAVPLTQLVCRFVRENARRTVVECVSLNEAPNFEISFPSANAACITALDDEEFEEYVRSGRDAAAKQDDDAAKAAAEAMRAIFGSLGKTGQA